MNNFDWIKPLVLDSSKCGIWFTSDTHFFHRNIIKFCNRPWNTVEEMNDGLINNWNNVVLKDDVVFHLGDFAYASNSGWKQLINRLNGHIHLILGNHDRSRYPGHQIMEMFDGVYNQLSLSIDMFHICLNHYPFLCYAGTYRKPQTIQLFGHIHSGPNSNGLDDERLKYLFKYQYDVGVDNNNYTPISWNQLKEKWNLM